MASSVVVMGPGVPEIQNNKFFLKYIYLKLQNTLVPSNKKDFLLDLSNKKGEFIVVKNPTSQVSSEDYFLPFKKKKNKKKIQGQPPILRQNARVSWPRTQKHRHEV